MRICGVGIVGPSEADLYLKQTLDSFARTCDEVVLVLNNVDHKTQEMIMDEFEYPGRVHLYHDNRDWGIYQRQIKEDLYKYIEKFSPDWVLSLDMDESFTPSTTRQTLEKLASTDEVAWYFWFLQKWNDEEHMNPNLYLWELRFWKYRRDLGFKIENKQMHCGSAPKWAYTYGFYAPVCIVHRGLLDRSNRLKKVERYKKYDPKAQWVAPSYYETLSSTYAGVPYDEKAEEEKVAKDVATYGKRTMPQIVIPKPMKIYRVLRLADNSILEIEEKYLDDTINQGGKEKFFKNLGPVAEVVIPSAEAPLVEETPEVIQSDFTPDPFTCQVCGRVAKSKLGLSAHARTHRVK